MCNGDNIQINQTTKDMSYLVDIKAKYLAEKQIKAIKSNTHESELANMDLNGLYQDSFKTHKANLIGYKGIIMGGGFDGSQPKLEPQKTQDNL